jgi:hypothetical protein
VWPATQQFPIAEKRPTRTFPGSHYADSAISRQEQHGRQQRGAALNATAIMIGAMSTA